MKNILNTLLASSRDGAKLSLTVKGLFIQLVPVIMLVLQAKGISVIESDITAIIEAATQLIALAVTFVGMVMSTWGLVRKLFNPVDFEEIDGAV